MELHSLFWDFQGIIHPQNNLYLQFMLVPREMFKFYAECIMFRVVWWVSGQLYSCIFWNIAVVNCSSFSMRWPVYQLSICLLLQKSCERIHFIAIKVEVTCDYSCNIWLQQCYEVLCQFLEWAATRSIYKNYLVWDTCNIDQIHQLIFFCYNLLNLSRDMSWWQWKDATTFASTQGCMIKNSKKINKRVCKSNNALTLNTLTFSSRFHHSEEIAY